jgi:hypothetical protein
VGVSHSTLLAIFCVMLAGEIASAVALYRTLKQAA